MAHNSSIAESLHYGRELIYAGIDGIRDGERLTLHSPDVHIARSVQQSLMAAIIGSTMALITCKVAEKRKRVLGTIVACGTAAFCADFIWRTRAVSSKMLDCAERAIDKARDKHWLDSHPIDYA